MHRCLLVPEIFRLICNEVDNRKGVKVSEFDTVQRNPSLLSLAQTCKTFQEPTLAMLWVSIPSLALLISSAGSEIWTVQDRQLQLTSNISASHIAIMKKYATFARHFGSFRSRDLKASPDVWAKLHSFLGDTVLFPNLLSIVFEDHYAMPFLSLFSTHNLIRFSLRLDPDLEGRFLSPFQPSTLVDMSSRSPCLQSIYLREFDLPEQQNCVITALSNWCNLSQVELSPAGPPALRALEQYHSGSLRRLGFTVTSWDLPPDSPGFPALEVLSIAFQNLPNGVHFMEDFLANDNLRELTLLVQTNKPTLENDWLRLVRSIKKHSSTLRSLDLAEQPELPYIDPNNITAPLSNAPLFLIAAEFQKLTNFRITHNRGYSIVDEDVRIFSQGLPLLEECHFGIENDRGPSIKFNTTIASLLFFAQNCPCLKRLYFPTDAREVYVHQTRQLLPPMFPGSNLEYLDVSDGVVDNPELAAKLIYDIFPNLQEFMWEDKAIGLDTDSSSSSDLGWNEVEDYLEKYKKQQLGTTHTDL